MHPKRLQHFGRAAESNHLALLVDCQCRQKDRNDPVLSERNPVFGMPGELKDEATIPSFVEELIRRQTPDRQSAQDEWSRAKAKSLARLFAVQPNEFDAPGLFDLPFGNNQVAVGPAQDGTRILDGPERMTSGS
jgi:hypothetical protein